MFCFKKRHLSAFLSPALIEMSPTRSPKNKPKKAVLRPKKAFKQRKIPIGLVGIPFQHYGVPVADINNDDVTIMMQTTISPSVVSRSNAPSSSHATTSTTQSFASPRSVDIVHSQIPVSAPIPKYPDNATQVVTYPNLSTTGFPQFFSQNELQDDLDFYNQFHDTLSMVSNPWQSDGRYATHHQHEINSLVLPPRSTLGFDDSDLSLNSQQPIMSYATNAPTLAYGTPAAYDSDMNRYFETAGTMMSNGPVFPFEPPLNDDAHARYNRYM